MFIKPVINFVSDFGNGFKKTLGANDFGDVGQKSLCTNKKSMDGH